MEKPTPRLVLCELGASEVPGLESLSPFCLKVHRALNAAGLPYERRHAARPDAYAPLNPARQVPVLLVDDEPVSDSTAILARIEALSGRRFGGGDASARAEAWLWEELADTALNGFVVAARWADDRNWPAVRASYFGAAPWLVRALVVPRVRARVVRALVARDVWRRGADACWARFDALLDHLEWRAPGAGFWLGDTLTVADLGLFAQLQSLRAPLTSPQRDAIAERTQLAAYLDRVDRATSASASGRDTEASGPRYIWDAVVHAAVARQPAA